MNQIQQISLKIQLGIPADRDIRPETLRALWNGRVQPPASLPRHRLNAAASRQEPPQKLRSA